jgi:hypothetical protein
LLLTADKAVRQREQRSGLSYPPTLHQNPRKILAAEKCFSATNFSKGIVFLEEETWSVFFFVNQVSDEGLYSTQTLFRIIHRLGIVAPLLVSLNVVFKLANLPAVMLPRAVDRACPQFQNNLVQSALPLKKRGHDTRISLPCPKSAGYD